MKANRQWPSKRLKYVVHRATEKAVVERGSHYIGLENVEPWTGRYLSTEAQIEVDSTQFRPGDVLFGKLRPYLAKVYVAKADGTCTSEMLVLRPGPEATEGFLFYRLVSADFIDVVNSTTFGSKMPRADWEQIGNIPVSVPSPQEQSDIVAFLDRETVEVDRLLVKKQRLIELLDEKRAALISHAVTQGLDPTVPMKSSGVEWLGSVPAHWQVKRLKWIAVMESGHTPDKKVAACWADCTIPWVSLNDTGQLRVLDYISETAFNVNELGIANSSARILPAGAVIFSRDATVGLCAIAAVPMAVSQHFIAWICSRVISPEFLLFAFRSMTQFLESLTTGATLKTIGMPEVRTLTIPVPPLDEQTAIAEFIKQERAGIDTVVAKTKKQVDLLREYRSALITAAVTGQIDIREQKNKVEVLA